VRKKGKTVIPKCLEAPIPRRKLSIGYSSVPQKGGLGSLVERSSISEDSQTRNRSRWIRKRGPTNTNQRWVIDARSKGKRQKGEKKSAQAGRTQGFDLLRKTTLLGLSSEKKLWFKGKRKGPYLFVNEAYLSQTKGSAAFRKLKEIGGKGRRNQGEQCELEERNPHSAGRMQQKAGYVPGGKENSAKPKGHTAQSGLTSPITGRRFSKKKSGEANHEICQVFRRSPQEKTHIAEGRGFRRRKSAEKTHVGGKGEDCGVRQFESPKSLQGGKFEAKPKSKRVGPGVKGTSNLNHLGRGGRKKKVWQGTIIRK